VIVSALSWSAGALSALGASLPGCVVVTPRESVVVGGAPLRGSWSIWPGAPEVGPAPEFAGSSRRGAGGCGAPLSLPRTQIRAYRWCNPPRNGCAIMSPNRSIGRVQGASFPSDRWVRTSL
jgi:hypothetical protein